MPSAPSLNELAEAALVSPAMTDARRLAAWVGGGQEVTASGVLRPAVAVEACQQLGFELPESGKLRSAMDADELQRAWTVATAADLILVTGKRATATIPSLQDDPERIVTSWISTAVLPFDLPDDPCLACLSVLHELGTAGKPVETASLTAAARDALEGPFGPGSPDDDICPHCGQRHDTGLPDVLGGFLDFGYDIEEEAEGHVAEAVEGLLYFGAAATGPGTTPGGTVTLTPLGRLLAEQVMMALAPEPGADAAALAEQVAALPPRIRETVAAPWFAARAPGDAARELLDYARRDDCPERPSALELAKEPGDPGLPAWRELAAEPGVGAYARQWLASRGEPVKENEHDEAWLLTDAVAQASQTAPLPVVAALFGGGLEQMTREDADAVVAGIRASGHPAAEEVADLMSAQSRGPDLNGAIAALLGGSPFGGPGLFDDEDDYLEEYGHDLPEGTLLQLKITLKGVSKPPVWRRVRVPASITLDALHQVVLGAMGWAGGHMHEFSDDVTEFGVPESDLGHADEKDFELADLIDTVGEHITYTYDFGDDWQHVIKIEKIIEPGTPDAARTTPECLAGKGACPPEDCGGSWGYAELKLAVADPSHEDHEDLMDWLGLDDPADFDPAAFSLDYANTRLRSRMRDRDPRRPRTTAVSSQAGKPSRVELVQDGEADREDDEREN